MARQVKEAERGCRKDGELTTPHRCSMLQVRAHRSAQGLPQRSLLDLPPSRPTTVSWSRCALIKRPLSNKTFRMIRKCMM